MTRGADLEAISRRGKRIRFLHIEARLSSAESGASRVGLVVPKYGRSAVRRNRVKRQLREWVRLKLLPLLEERSDTRPTDIVIRARPPAYDAATIALRHDFEKIASAIAAAVAKRGRE